MASPTESKFKTPESGRVRSFVSSEGTPVTIPASPFMKKLGCGTGVNVYLMNRTGKPNASPWAVKKINSQCGGHQVGVYQQRLNDEAQVLKGLHHPNIIGFRAVATAKDGSKCLAMEYGGESSLYDLIEQRKEDGLEEFPVASVEKVALHVARGLRYLHTEKKLLHGDMKSFNVVVKGDFESVKICDVGVSLQLDENMKVSDPKATYIGTEPWAPKEALNDGEITDKADIFAYGLTLWEMMTLSLPHVDLLMDGHDDDDDGDDEEDDSMEAGSEDAYYERVGTRPPLDAHALAAPYRRMVELFYLCTEQDPEKRPSAAQIVEALESNASLNKTNDEVIVIE